MKAQANFSSYTPKPQYYHTFYFYLFNHFHQFLHWTNLHGTRVFRGQIPMVTGSDNSVHQYCKQRKLSQPMRAIAWELLYTTYTYSAVSQVALQNWFGPSEIILTNRVNQSQGAKLSLTHSHTHTQAKWRSPSALLAVGLENHELHHK